MPEKWDVYILGTDEIIGDPYDSYFEALTETKVLNKKTKKTYCVTLHGVGST